MSGVSIAVVGAQWGDEGKGKVVDIYSEKVDYIVRFQGGNNAGHTLVVNGKKTVLHLIPSGILQPGKICLIANGVVFDPLIFFEEVESLKESGNLSGKAEDLIKVSERAHVILPYHRTLDALREKKAGEGKGKIGTTVRGIGPAYEDKIARRGIQLIDLLHPELLREKLARALEEKNVLLKHHYGEAAVEVEPIYEQCLELGEKLKPHMCDVRKILVKAVAANKGILFEGAQGTLLDVDHGTYPYVTSSNTVASGALVGCGLAPGNLKNIIGITKAYTTRVGTGPFPTEIEETDAETAKKIRKIGEEFGATTGRPRRTGWLDLVGLKYATEINGLTGIALTKSDVLQGFESIEVCVAYKLDGKEIDYPSCVEDLERVEPVYKTMKGWPKYDTKKAKKFTDLPKELQDYVKNIERALGIPVVLIGTGPGREETILV